MSDRDLSTVVPRLYLALPNSVPADFTLTGDDSPVESKLAGDLVVLYGFDKGTHFRLANGGDLKELATTPAELHEKAVENLNSLPLHLEFHQGDDYHMVTAGGDHEATLVFHSAVLEFLADQVPGKLVVAIPARDLFLVASSADPRHLAALQRKVNELIETAEKPLSGLLYTRDVISGEWSVLSR
ncbi:uncharacterized protein DUF1444 [Roseimicrobium gellanilyticum]|uniref:Uncharacterized protein DUF1444 n=1 Tax=Roseimicrobium gellanilyticum TaxID=748857 RepID=A0A366HBG2_9BACT|nr:DUF1444 family protein [Roseimicrobium gellanilyticum]RBP39646.1 uncharacterized protein DUF1444 [Roseimicrobium gellanilyticum]